MANTINKIIVLILFAAAACGTVLLYFSHGLSFYTFHALSGLMAIKHAIAHGFLSGEYPLWNPLMLAGAPFHSGIGIADPLLISYLFLDGIPALVASSYLALFIAGLGMYLYLHKSWGLSITSSILGGILYLANPFFAATSHELPFMAPAVYLPWIFLFYDRGVWYRSIASTLLSGLCIALSFFSGNLESFYFILLFFFVVQAARIAVLCAELKSLQPVWREWKYLALAVFSPFVFAAVDLFPTIQMIFDSGRKANNVIGQNLLFYFVTGIVSVLIVFIWDRASRRAKVKQGYGRWIAAALICLLFTVNIDWQRLRVDFNLNILYPNIKLLMLEGQEAFQILIREAGIDPNRLKHFMEPRFVFYIQPPAYLFTLTTLVLFCFGLFFGRRFDLRLYGLIGIALVLFPFTFIPNPISRILGLDAIAYPRLMFGFFFTQALVAAYGFEKLVIDQFQWDSQRLLQKVSWLFYLIAGIGIAMLSVLVLFEYDADRLNHLFDVFSETAGSVNILENSWLHGEIMAHALQLFINLHYGIFLWGLSKYAALITLVLAVGYPRHIWKYLCVTFLALDVLCAWNYYTFQKNDIRAVQEASYESEFLSRMNPDQRMGVADETAITMRNFYDTTRVFDIGANMPFFWKAKTIEGAALNLAPGLFKAYWAFEPLNTLTPTRMRKFPSRLYDLMGMTHLLSSSPLREKRYKKVGEGQRYTIYENKGAVPRFYFPEKLHSSELISFERMLRDRYWNPVRHAWIEGAPGRAVSIKKPSAPPAVGIERETYNTLALRVDADRNVLLSTSEAYHPNWRVYVDGSEETLERVNFYFRGVFLDAGEHDVEFIYSPQTFKAGAAVSITAFFILILTVTREFWTLKRGAHR